ILKLEKTKTTQHNEIATQQKEIASLKRRVKQIKKKNRSRTHRLKRLYKVGLSARIESSGDEVSLGEDTSKQGRIDAIDADEEITPVSVQNDADKEMFDVDALNKVVEVSNTAKLIIDVAQVSVAGNIVSTASIPFSAISVATTVSTATTTTATIIIVDEVTLDQALKEMKSINPNVKWLVIQELSESITTISSQQPQDKAFSLASLSSSLNLACNFKAASSSSLI
nr:hypothetical protein [Tanacetum cinerariifolium]